MRLLLLIVIAGCQPDEREPKKVRTEPTSGPTTTTSTTSTTSTVETRFAESVTLASGETIIGERIATYDQSVWWTDPTDEILIALFDPTRWADYPDDDSIRIVAESQIVATEFVTLQGASYVGFLRGEDMVIPQPPLDGVSWVITGNAGYHLEEDGYGNFAWDLVKTDEAGSRYTGYGADNTDYLVWDDPVYLPVPGTVVEVVRDAPDNTPGAYTPDAINNLVGLWMGGHHYLYFLHFRRNSIPMNIQIGEVLPAGTLLGNVGNSGITLEPHLHMTALYWDDSEPGDERYWSVPMEWKDLWTSTETSGATLQDFGAPNSFEWIAASAF